MSAAADQQNTSDQTTDATLAWCIAAAGLLTVTERNALKKRNAERHPCNEFKSCDQCAGGPR